MWFCDSQTSITDELLIGWIRKILPLSDEIRSKIDIKLSPITGAGGLSAQMLAIFVHSQSKPDLMQHSQSYILKMNHLGSLDSSKELGNAREAHFYSHLAHALSTAKVETPEIIIAEGNMEDGSYRLVMADLTSSAVQTGYFFGPGSPLNWGKDLNYQLTRVSTPVTFREVAMDTFIQMARMHRKYWREQSILQNYAWLRGRDYILGNDKDQWEREQLRAIQAWEKCKEQRANKTSSIRWSDNLISCIDASISKSNWETFLSEKRSQPWTLVHGDMHPANVLWDWTKPSSTGISPRGTSIFIDWAMVGVGSGPQDMGQYMISHASPEDRRLIEKELMLGYYLELTTNTMSVENTSESSLHPDLLTQSYTFEDCWQDYIQGGARRWVWLFCVLTSLCPEFVSQYFHDQLAAFLQDHDITSDNIGMPL